ncbi:MAG: thermonuclease family protein [Actinomycetota bacterium]
MGLALLLAAAAATATAVGSTGTAATVELGRHDRGRAEVIEVIDGDTIEVRLDGGRHRVRLLGVDAPESVHPTAPVQCFGPEASARLTALLPPGTEVALTRDVESHDHYDRVLAYVHRADDGLFVNRWLLDQGLADAAFYEPNTTHRAELEAAAHTARRHGHGLWGVCDGPDQPLDPGS